MRVVRELGRFVAIALVALAGASAVRAYDVPYVPTPEPVVREMLRLAEVGPQDVVYDLGSGDGRIVIMAAKEFGARGVGVDIDPERIAEARINARKAGVADKVRFVQGNLFDIDLRPATAVTLYLLPSVNLALKPKLLAEPQAWHAGRVARLGHGHRLGARGRAHGQRPQGLSVAYPAPDRGRARALTRLAPASGARARRLRFAKRARRM